VCRLIWSCIYGVTKFRFIFDSLAHDNDASFATLSEVSISLAASNEEQGSGLIIASGTQRVRKFNKSKEDEVLVLLAVQRVESRRVDLVLTENVPLSQDGSTSLSTDVINDIKQTFCETAKSLVITNYDLFA
jgi:hypothetical protein